MVELMDPRQAERLRTLPFTGADGRPLAVREVIGAGRATFERAADALLAWQMHERAGLEVVASSPVVRPGEVVVVGIRLGPVRITAPCRVREVVREERRAGFTYGTLPGHPVSGEESFFVEHHADDTVTASVTSVSRPAKWYTRFGAPASRIVQKLAARRYVGALRH
jgi:uncharacterized protein (UPF0548 family)